MATFIKHEPCPSCGSRNNLGRYSDGSAFCFGCHYTERAGVSPWIGERNGSSNEYSDDNICWSGSSTTQLDERSLEWLGRYGLDIESALRAGFRWDSYWEQLLMPLYDNNGKLCCIQAKNFNPQRASKAKYYNVGDKSNSTTTYGTGERLVLTEDIVSAIKVGRSYLAMPLLGTHISRTRLAQLKAKASSLVVWLDEDKWREAREIADAANLIGLSATTLLTPLDPKEYNNDAIKQLVG